MFTRALLGFVSINQIDSVHRELEEGSQGWASQVVPDIVGGFCDRNVLAGALEAAIIETHPELSSLCPNSGILLIS